MARKPLLEAAPEADRIDDTPHPRETQEFFGHREAEQGLLNAYRAGRLPQAYVIGGQQGVGRPTGGGAGPHPPPAPPPPCHKPMSSAASRGLARRRSPGASPAFCSS